MNKEKFLEAIILFFLLSTITLFIASHNIIDANLDKIGIFLFFLSASINGIHWKNIILNLNTPVSSLKEAINILNEFSEKNSSWINHITRLRFDDPEIHEHNFRNHPHKSLVSAVLFTTKDKISIIPILLVPLIPIWFFGIDKFIYDRYYQASPIIHNTLFYLGLIAFTYILWLPTSYSISSYLLKRKIK